MTKATSTRRSGVYVDHPTRHLQDEQRSLRGSLQRRQTQWCDVYTAAYTTFTLTTDVYTAWHLERHPQEEVVSTRPSLHDIYEVENDVYAAAYSDANTPRCGSTRPSLHDIYKMTDDVYTAW